MMFNRMKHNLNEPYSGQNGGVKMAGPGKMLLDAVSPLLEFIAPLAPGEIFLIFLPWKCFNGFT